MSVHHMGQDLPDAISELRPSVVRWDFFLKFILVQYCMTVTLKTKTEIGVMLLHPRNFLQSYSIDGTKFMPRPNLFIMTIVHEVHNNYK